MGGWRCGGGEDSSGGGGNGMKGGDKEDAYRMRRQQQGKQGQGSEGWGTCESFFSILFHSLLILIWLSYSIIEEKAERKSAAEDQTIGGGKWRWRTEEQEDMAMGADIGGGGEVRQRGQSPGGGK